MKEGKAPIGPDGHPMELHHVDIIRDKIMQTPKWPNDVDGDVFCKLLSKGFDFSKAYTLRSHEKRKAGKWRKR